MRFEKVKAKVVKKTEKLPSLPRFLKRLRSSPA
jgi:HD-like signal output (HDOD) protein